eukprot:2103611-Pleurochrysis_carterae.AAC.1
MPSHRDRSRAEYADWREQRARQQPAPREGSLDALIRGQSSAHVQAGVYSSRLLFADKGSSAEGAMRTQAAAQIRAGRRRRLEAPNFWGASPLSDRAWRAEGPVANDCTSPCLQSDVRLLAEAPRLMHWASERSLSARR